MLLHVAYSACVWMVLMGFSEYSMSCSVLNSTSRIKRTLSSVQKGPLNNKKLPTLYTRALHILYVIPAKGALLAVFFSELTNMATW